ncbi:hypothetical protein [Saprospira grandis]|nr:hypothetical protein [Saprospira grandis]
MMKYFSFGASAAAFGLAALRFGARKSARPFAAKAARSGPMGHPSTSLGRSTKGLRFWLLGFGLLFLCAHSSAQLSPKDSLEQKYWRYRFRFLKEYIRLGQGPGQSIPMGAKMPTANCQTNWHMLRDKCSTQKGQGLVEWGDATIHLGLYMATLALEAKLLEQKGQDRSACLKELWLALEAYDRLDKQAETFLGLPPSLNGFFIRDDVPPDFYLEFDSANCCRASAACQAPSAKDGYFISQDQVFYLYVGWLLTAQLLEGQKYQDSLPSFDEKVAGQVHRLSSYFLQENWTLKAPNGEKIPNQWGGDLRMLNYALAEGGNRLAGPYTGQNYQGEGSQGWGLAAFTFLGWRLPMPKHNRGMIVQSAILVNAWSAKKMARYCQRHDFIAWAFVDAIVNRRKLHRSIKMKEIEQLLQSAPWDGPCFGTPGCQEVPGWMGFDRWVHPELKNGNPWGRHFEYNGLDYMLMYNLYQYYQSLD